MESQLKILEALIEFADQLDNFGSLERNMSLRSAAIGTLRKDTSIAKDIRQILGASTLGFGVVALSRILIEDYLHILFLIEDADSLEQNIEKFNLHPKVKHYIALRSMQEYGFVFLEEGGSKILIEKILAGFDESKDQFLRRKESKEFDPDDYWRTWTKLSLEALIKRTSLPDTEDGRKSLKFMTETYDFASSVIHHDSFLIWLLASQDPALIAASYPDMALRVANVAFSRMINLAINTVHSQKPDDTLRAQQLNALADIMEGIA